MGIQIFVERTNSGDLKITNSSLVPYGNLAFRKVSEFVIIPKEAIPNTLSCMKLVKDKENNIRNIKVTY